MQKAERIKYAKRAALPVLAALFIEILFFNYPFIEWKLSGHAPQRDLKESMVITGGREDPEGIYVHPFEALQIDVPVRGPLDSLYLNITEDEMSCVDIEIEVTDDGFSAPYALGSVRLAAEEEGSRWNRLHAFGNVQDLTLRLMARTEGYIHLWDVQANAPAELRFNPLRFLAVLFLGMLLRYFFTASSWQVPYVRKTLRHKLAIAVLLTAETAAVFYLSWIGRPRVENCDNIIGVGAQTEYQQLAKSLLEGKLTINSEEKPDWDSFMDRPYDWFARKASCDTNEDLYNDVCYYKGNYYVYFGVVPVLLFYLPYRLLTGGDLNNYWPNLLCWIITLLAAARMVDLIIRKRFPKTSFPAALLMMAVMPVCMGCLMLVQRFSIYELPSSAGIMLAAAGMCFWLDAWRENGTLCCTKASAGSLCMALVAGCRPPQVLLLLTGLILFGRVLVRDGKICAHKNAREILSLCTPVLLVAALLMAYNFARFGSPFNFGEKYNLTGCNLSMKRFTVKEAVFGIYMQLLQPPALQTEFPFVVPQSLESGYIGYRFAQSSIDPLCGGVFCLSPVLLSLFPALFLKGPEKRGPEKAAVLLTLLLAFALCGYESSAAGFSGRYRVDSSLLLAAGLLFAVPLLEERFSESPYALAWHRVLTVLVLVSLLLPFFAFFNAYELRDYNSPVWYAFRYFFQPW